MVPELIDSCDLLSLRPAKSLVHAVGEVLEERTQDLQLRIL